MDKLRNFLALTDLGRDGLESVLEDAMAFKVSRGTGRGSKDLDGQTWALLFHKSSTRTRVSFEVGIHELGGHAMILDQGRMQTGRGESVEDTAKVLSRYIHGIIIRTYEHGFLESFAESGSIPVVNALSDALHPCQVLSDLLTLGERFGRPGNLLGALKGKKVAFYGDCSCNMAHSWILGAALSGIELTLCGPEEYGPKPFIQDYLDRAGLGGTWHFTSDPLLACQKADAIYTDVWVSMGSEAEEAARLKAFRPYQVNERIMAGTKDGIFLHCLPAHVGEEVSEAVFKSPASVVFDQAENRLHAQKAILSILGKSH
jgi:ornithine carbamoyltransferase